MIRALWLSIILVSFSCLAYETNEEPIKAIPIEEVQQKLSKLEQTNIELERRVSSLEKKLDSDSIKLEKIVKSYYGSSL